MELVKKLNDYHIQGKIMRMLTRKRFEIIPKRNYNARWYLNQNVKPQYPPSSGLRHSENPSDLLKVQKGREAFAKSNPFSLGRSNPVYTIHSLS